VKVRNSPVSAAAFAALLHILLAHPAAGQRLPADHPFVSKEVRLPRVDPLLGPGTDPHARGVLDSSLAHTRYHFAADTAKGGSKRDIVPYAVAGAIAGGVVAYAALPKSCDVSENWFCQPTLVAQHVLGAVMGAWVGAAVGLFREPR